MLFRSLRIPPTHVLFRSTTRLLWNVVKFILVDSKDAWLDPDKDETLEGLLASLEDMFDKAEEWSWQNLSKVYDTGCILTFGIPNSLQVPELLETSTAPDLRFSDGVTFDPDDEKGNLGAPVVWGGCVGARTRSATAFVLATGARTQFGDIATRLMAHPPETEFERGTRQFGLLIARAVLFLVLFVFLVSAALHHDPLEALLFAVALAVAALLVLLYGCVVLSHAKFDVFPEFVQPQVTIQTEAPGLAPGQVAVEVDAVHEQPVLRRVRLEAGARSRVVDGLGDVDVDPDAEAAGREMNSLNFLDATDQTVRGAALYLGRNGAKVGLTGFCMGGALTILGAARLSEITAAVCFYGLPPATVAKPADVKVPLQGHFANKDDWCTKATVDGFEQELRKAGRKYEFFRYEAEHGFMNEQRDVHDRAAAELAWQRMLKFWSAHIG